MSRRVRVAILVILFTIPSPVAGAADGGDPAPAHSDRECAARRAGRHRAMSTLPGRSGAIALSLSFAATFAIVVGVAGTASDLLVVPERPVSKVRPVPPPTVMPAIRPGLVVSGDGVTRDGRRLGTADAVIADHDPVTEALRVDPAAGKVSTTIWVKPDGSPAAALAVAAAALDAGYDLVLVVADETQRPYLACEITAAPTAAAIAAAEMSGSLAAACAAATAVAPEPGSA